MLHGTAKMMTCCSVGSIVTMVVTNLNLYCVCVCETVVWKFRLYLFFHRVLQVLTGFLTGETGLGGLLFNPRAESESTPWK